MGLMFVSTSVLIGILSQKDNAESLETISKIVALEVAKTSTAKNLAIALTASKELLDTFLVHRSHILKEMLRGQDLKKVMDKFRLFSSLNFHNKTSTF